MAGVSPDFSGSGGVSTFTGQVILTSAVRIASNGFKLPFSTGLSYVGNGSGGAAGFGGDWLMGSLAGLVVAGGEASYQTAANDTKTFVDSGGTFQATFFVLDVLTSSGGTYQLATPEGSRRSFDSAGRLTAYAGAGDSVAVSVAYDSDPAKADQVVSVGAATGGDSWEYVFTWSGAGGHITSIVYKVNTRSVLKTDYGYDGTSGKLITVKTYENSTASTGTPDWGSVPIAAERFTYHADGLLRHVVPPAEYRQMVNNGLNPDSTGSGDLPQFNGYAETEYEYMTDGSKRVSRMYTHGRRYEYGFAYTSQAQSGSSLNVWRMKTEVSKPGEVAETFYLNAVGEVILKRIEQKSGAAVLETWYPVYQKFEEGSARIILSAEASAIASVSEAAPGLVTLEGSAGKIEEYTYNGDGLLYYTTIRNGTGSTAIKVRQLTYTSGTVSGLGTVRPLASETIYKDEAGTEALTTTYEYEDWYEDTLQPGKVIQTLPVVSAGENGSGDAVTTERYYDIQGFLTKSVDGSGTATEYEYSAVRDARTLRIDDAGGTFDLHTDYDVDDRGRTILELGPEHEIDLGGTATLVRRGRWTYYKDREGELWTFGGYQTAGPTDQIVGAVRILRTNVPADRPSGYDDYRMDFNIAASYEDSGIPSPDDSFGDLFPRSSWVEWNIGLIDTSSKLRESWTYWEIPTATYFGTLDVNYGRKLVGYDVAGREDEVTCPGGTTDKITFNAMGWPVQEELGTGEGLIVTRVNDYDGNGNLTKVTLPVDGTPANDRVTDYSYDWRDRRTGEQTEVEKDGGGSWMLLTVTTYDNRDLAISVTGYHTSASSGNRTSYRTMAYDSLGRLYRTSTYAVASDGTTSDPQVDNLYYDEDGRLVKSVPSGSKLFTETEYDALGRIATVYRACDLSNSSSSSSSSSAPPEARTGLRSVPGGTVTVIEQEEIEYDDAGNRIATTLRKRYDDATGGGPLGDDSSQPKARVSYAATYPDAIGRTQATADYGTNDGSPWSRADTIPARTGITPQPEVSSFLYDPVGNIVRLTNPAGIRTVSTWDQAGRLTMVVENYPESGSSSSSSSSSSGTASVDSRTTRYEYTPDGWLKKLKSDNAATGQQITEWVYGVSPAKGSALYSKRLVYQKVFPDASGTGNRVTYTYNRQLQPTGLADQLGTIHVYSLDKLGRLLADTVSSFGSGVDTAVGKIENAYNERGLGIRAASYDTAGTSKLNEIAWVYNGFNQPVTEYQEHSGGVNTSTSLKVVYSYADGSLNTTRPTGVKYPHTGSGGTATVIDWAYTGQLAAAISRIDEIKQSGTILSSWRYVGLSMVAAQKYNAATNTELTYGSSADGYAGYDRFGRIIETVWKSGGSELVHSQYGRNAVGGIVWRKDVEAHAMSVTTQDNFYWYDGLQQVRQHQRGALTPGSPPYTGITGLQQTEVFGYDETGNWQSYYSGDPSLTQSRAHNTANQIESISGPVGVVQPAFNPPGNMTTMPDPDDWTNGYTCKWDAWHRLVQIKDGGTTIADYSYDARTRRIRKVTAETRDYYYDKEWRALEERVSGTIKSQYVWNPDDRWNLIRRQRSVSSTFDETHYVLADYLDPVAIVSAAGAVQERYGYDAFGPVQIMEPDFDPRGTSSYSWDWLFHGEFIDAESGLYNYGYRYYHPQLGRWLSRDPLGEQEIVDVYTFLDNRSINRIDYLGLYGLPSGGNHGLEPSEWTCKAFLSVGCGDSSENPGDPPCCGWVYTTGEASVTRKNNEDDANAFDAASQIAINAAEAACAGRGGLGKDCAMEDNVTITGECQLYIGGVKVPTGRVTH